MAHKITMPASGQTAAESLIVRWHVKEGDQIKRGDVLFEIETDKATMNVESFAQGTLLKVLYAQGDKVEAGKIVAYIGKSDEMIGIEDMAQPQKIAAVQEDEYQPIIKQKKTIPEVKEQSKPVESADMDIVQASPAARKLAREKGYDIKELFKQLNKVVKVADVHGYAPETDADYDVIVPSTMRRVIARRMVESASQAPQFTVSVCPDMTEFIALRKQINEVFAAQGVKVSFNDMLAKCVCIAVKAVPYSNAQYVSDEEIRINRHVSVGIAVALPEGLVVPVIRHADLLSIKETARQSGALISAAKDGSLQAEQMQGGTITISNLGMYGIDNFTALVNRPESAILAVGGIIETPIASDGAVALRPVMNITASFDHRMIDGGVGALFMAELKKLIEHPVSILL